MVSDEIIKVLDAFANKIGVTVNWTQDNALPYLQQLCGKYVTYEMATSVFWIVIGICLLFLGKYLVGKFKSYMKQDDESGLGDFESLLCIMSIVCAVFCIGGGIATIGDNIFDIITCLTFPEKVILDELQSVYQSLNAK